MDSSISTAVLLIFFNRPELFARVFDMVRKARPKILFLYQDGPREGRSDDVEKINRCREIAENIDWDCTVHKKYQECNMGCDPSGYIAQTWAFSLTDSCIVLEDDCLPGESFLRFCDEMLERYMDDERIGFIAGSNYDGISEEVREDIFFTSHISIHGWASWKRVISQWDGTYSFLDNSEKRLLLENVIKNKKYIKNFINMCEEHKRSGNPHFETILIANHLMNNYLSIVPQRNQTLNIGIIGESTHYASDIRLLPKGIRKAFTMSTYELHFPINTPDYVCEYYDYKKRVYRMFGWGHPLVKAYRLIESTVYVLRSEGLSQAITMLSDRFKKLVKKVTY